MAAKYTSGPWRAVAQGGSSTVICTAQPSRNDSRIPSYGYGEGSGFCVAYPFLDDEGQARRDFVCFSHADARLIAAAPDLLEALIEVVETLRREAPGTPLYNHRFDALGIKANAAIATAEGRA